MGQSLSCSSLCGVCKFDPMSCSVCCLSKETQEPRYARYTSTSEEEVNFENIVGECLELDPSLIDCKAGEEKIREWSERIAPDLGLPDTEISINRLKCLKYWDTVIVKDLSKLSGSTVKFCFEKKSPDDLPRLVIEHRGKSVLIRNASKRAKNQPTYARPLVQQPNSDKEIET